MGQGREGAKLLLPLHPAIPGVPHPTVTCQRTIPLKSAPGLSHGMFSGPEDPAGSSEMGEGGIRILSRNKISKLPGGREKGQSGGGGQGAAGGCSQMTWQAEERGPVAKPGAASWRGQLEEAEEDGQEERAEGRGPDQRLQELTQETVS